MNRFRSVLALTRALSAVAALVATVAASGCAQTTLPDSVTLNPGPRADLHRYEEEWADAARLGRIDILQALVAAGYPIDATTREGYTAVILAAYRHQAASLDYLLSAGANPCLGDWNGNTSVQRHKRRAKTDRLDVIKLVINLRAWLRGERDRMHVVHVPSPQDEASRQLMRDRGELQKEVLQHRVRMRKLLATLGCWENIDSKAFTRCAGGHYRSAKFLRQRHIIDSSRYRDKDAEP